MKEDQKPEAVQKIDPPKCGPCPECGSSNCQDIHYDGDGGYQVLCNDCGFDFWEIVRL